MTTIDTADIDREIGQAFHLLGRLFAMRADAAGRVPPTLPEVAFPVIGDAAKADATFGRELRVYPVGEMATSTGDDEPASHPFAAIVPAAAPAVDQRATCGACLGVDSTHACAPPPCTHPIAHISAGTWGLCGENAMSDTPLPLLSDGSRDPRDRSPAACVKCGKPVEVARRCYAFPTCFACLPPPPDIAIAPTLPRQTPDDGREWDAAADAVTRDAAGDGGQRRARKPAAPWEPPGRVKITLAGLGIDAVAMLPRYREATADNAITKRGRERHFREWCIGMRQRGVGT